jgi:hypothetical protein
MSDDRGCLARGKWPRHSRRRTKAMLHTVIFNSLLAGVAEGDDLAHHRRMRVIFSFLFSCPPNMRYMSRVHRLNFEADNHWKWGE